ncbi:MAG: hypothetical protein JO318_12375 [Chloroflexi bacterium]|nr:hypothetical protein [Chloroflexota bacterium]
MKPREPTRPLVWLLAFIVAIGALVSRRDAPRSRGGVSSEAVRLGYERSDMRAVAVVIGGVGLIVILGVLFTAVTLLETAVTGITPSVGAPTDLVGGLAAAPRPTPPAPALESEPGQSLDPYMAAEQAKLNGYRWVDRSAGIAAMPIDRAMDLIAQRGLPARQSTSARDAGDVSPSTASSGRMEERSP